MAQRIKKTSKLSKELKTFLWVGDSGFEIMKRILKRPKSIIDVAYATGVPIFVLTMKLNLLEKKGAVERMKIEGDVKYGLTDKGKEIYEVLEEQR